MLGRRLGAEALRRGVATCNPLIYTVCVLTLKSSDMPCFFFCSAIRRSNCSPWNLYTPALILLCHIRIGGVHRIEESPCLCLVVCHLLNYGALWPAALVFSFSHDTVLQSPHSHCHSQIRLRIHLRDFGVCLIFFSCAVMVRTALRTIPAVKPKS